VLVRYHEIALKRRNRPLFVSRLARNLRRAGADLGALRVSSLAGRLLVEAPDDVSWEDLRGRLGEVFGVANFSRGHRLPRDLDALSGAAVEALGALDVRTFCVRARRSDKQFPSTSGEIERRVGAAVCAATGLAVDLERPDVTFFVEVLRDRTYYFFEKLPGPGGVPVGGSGEVVALLSGGIDSPVAAYRMMKRGCRVTFVHFHAFPLLDRTTVDKSRELARLLTRFQYRTRLLLVPFGPVQQAIVASAPAPLRVVLYRRFMVRIAERLAAGSRARALVTGESLGQVASQTLDNIAVIDDVARGPILRPLVGMDKEEITREARRIGTFEVSTLPDQDCCQLFVPRSPATAASRSQVERAERALDLPALVERAIAEVASERFTFPERSGPCDEEEAIPSAGAPEPNPVS
jgi:thiamine biosynthesis protein ThiI